jgi:hypothetical protein
MVGGQQDLFATMRTPPPRLPEVIPQLSQRPYPHASIASGLRAVILMAGSVRESTFSRAIGRSLLDLPLRQGWSVLDEWAAQGATLAAGAPVTPLPLRVLINRDSRTPKTLPEQAGTTLSVEFDRQEFRGTGGLLRDLVADYRPDDLILVANANQVLHRPLPDLVSMLMAAMGDVALLAGADGTPFGLSLIRCSALASIKSKGFVDLKEQALPAIAAAFDVRVATHPGTAVTAVRTLETYLGALRRLHSLGRAPDAPEDPFGEDWFRTFGIVEDGAVVHESARVHDSVVLRHAHVGAGAVLVRSLVCESARVGPGQVVLDDVVTAEPTPDRGAAP